MLVAAPQNWFVLENAEVTSFATKGSMVRANDPTTIIVWLVQNGPYTASKDDISGGAHHRTWRLLSGSCVPPEISWLARSHIIWVCQMKSRWPIRSTPNLGVSAGKKESKKERRHKKSERATDSRSPAHGRSSNTVALQPHANHPAPTSKGRTRPTSCGACAKESSRVQLEAATASNRQEAAALATWQMVNSSL
jgi:hypothetical protein